MICMFKPLLILIKFAFQHLFCPMLFSILSLLIRYYSFFPSLLFLYCVDVVSYNYYFPLLVLCLYYSSNNFVIHFVFPNIYYKSYILYLIILYLLRVIYQATNMLYAVCKPLSFLEMVY